MEIRGCVALVTGANRGLGRAFVEALGQRGAVGVWAAARRTGAVADLVAADAKRVRPLTLDINNPGQVQAAAAAASDVTLLINNAGRLDWTGLVAADSLDGARAEMETNYFGTLAMVRAFAPVLAANGGGAIVNVSASAALINYPIVGSYCASKAAVRSVTQGVRAELAGQRTAVIAVLPGPVNTDMNARMPGDKFPPAQIAEATLAAIERGETEIYPDAKAAAIREAFATDPRALEREAAALTPEP